MTHALAIGATGMLSGAVHELSARGWTVTVLARDRRSLLGVASTAPGQPVHPVSVDYRDSRRLLEALRQAEEARGHFRLALAWIHGTAPQGHDVVAQALGSTPPPCLYLEILGSASQDPSTLGRERAERFASLPYLRHRRVLLGRAAGGTRWLTHDEICKGVLEALEVDVTNHVVGELDAFKGSG